MNRFCLTIKKRFPPEYPMTCGNRESDSINSFMQYFHERGRKRLASPSPNNQQPTSITSYVHYSPRYSCRHQISINLQVWEGWARLGGAENCCSVVLYKLKRGRVHATHVCTLDKGTFKYISHASRRWHGKVETKAKVTAKYAIQAQIKAKTKY